MHLVVKSDYSKETKKIIIGYSDLTPLMVYFAQKYGWTAINAPMLKDFVLNNKSKQSYKSIIDFIKNKIKLSISDLKPLNNFAKSNFSKNKEIFGKVIGGNITCIVSTIGTKWQIRTNDRILFLEDVNVFGYQLDRLLTHMKNSGIFDNVKAIIFGDFGDYDNKRGDNKDAINKCGANKILKNFASSMNIPVYKSSKFGHQKDNLPIVLEADGIIKSYTFAQIFK
jgi:muramoyltetrapeptide carboxypeptidase